MGTNKVKEQKKQYDLDRIHNSFTENIESLRVFVSNLAPEVRKHDRILIKKTERASKDLTKLIGLYKNDLERKESEKAEFKLTDEQVSRIISITRNLPRMPPYNVELLYKSAFVMLISYLDFLISDSIHFYYQTYPKSLSGKELSIALSELELCSDISEATDFIINKEVEKVTYKSLDDQIKYFENNLNIDCKKSIIGWSRIKEATERRNLIVHNNSRINRRYLTNVDLSLIPEKTKDLKEGDQISIKENYFMAVLHEIFIAGVILAQCCWRKWKKDEIMSADTLLIRSIYDALVKEEWATAERLGLFSKECDVCNDRNRLYLNINYWQSLKWQNKSQELEKELEKFDVSGLSPIYVLSLSALKSDGKSFHKNIKKAIISDNLKKEDLMEWPLFREFRKDPHYEKGIEEEFESISKQGSDSKNSH